jgi:hypothetical protein
MARTIAKADRYGTLAITILDLGTRLGLGPALQRFHVLDGQRLGLLLDASVALQNLGTELGQDSSAASRAAGCCGRYWFDERLVHAVERHPGPLVVHAHVAGGGTDRAGVADALKELHLAGADARPGFENDADSDPCHGDSLPRLLTNDAMDGLSAFGLFAVTADARLLRAGAA